MEIPESLITIIPSTRVCDFQEVFHYQSKDFNWDIGTAKNPEKRREMTQLCADVPATQETGQTVQQSTSHNSDLEEADRALLAKGMASQRGIELTPESEIEFRADILRQQLETGASVRRIILDKLMLLDTPTNIQSSWFLTEAWPDEYPLKRPSGYPRVFPWPPQRIEHVLFARKCDGICVNCGDKAFPPSCNCDPDDWRAQMAKKWTGRLRLKEYLGTGVGVQLTKTGKPGDVLGDYVGEIIPPEHYRSTSHETNLTDLRLENDCDGDYSYAINSSASQDPVSVGQISAASRGNWTRFLAHSCDPNARMDDKRVGRHRILAVELTKNVRPDHQLTISYGEGYFRAKGVNNLFCKCGRTSCKFKDPLAGGSSSGKSRAK